MDQSYTVYKKEARRLSHVGAAFLGTVGAICSALAAFCMKTDKDTAMLCLLIPFLYFGSSLLYQGVICHGYKKIYIFSLTATCILSFSLTLDPIKTALSLAASLIPLAILKLTEKPGRRMTETIITASVMWGAILLISLIYLAYQKYGNCTFDTLVHAFGSFKEVVLSAPKETLNYLNETNTSGEYTDFIKNYEQTVTMLDSTVSLLLYSVPALYLNICCIGGFITVIALKYYRKMAHINDTIGIFYTSPITAWMYIALYLISIFVATDSVFGILISTLYAPISIALAYEGLLFIFKMCQKAEKEKRFVIILTVSLLIIPSLALLVLSYAGAYHSIGFYKFTKNSR